MPTDTTDQQITMPIGADSADNPVAFINMVADVEQRLVRRYASIADRTARMSTLTENDISTLADVDRVEVYDGTNHVSLYRRGLWALARLTSSQTMTPSSTALQDVTQMVVAMPTAGTFFFRGIIYYDTSATADIKFAFTFPAGATVRWNIMGPPTTAGSTGDGTYTTTTTSDSSVSYGGAGVGTTLGVMVQGEYVAGGTAGNLQLRAAQATSEASNTTVTNRSRIEVVRIL